MLLGARQFFERRGTPLPYDAEVEYLESTGTQWIDTLINPLIEPRVVADMEFTNSADSDYWGNTNYGVSPNGVYLVDFENRALQYYRYASAVAVQATTAQDGRHIWSVGKEVLVDGVLKYTSPNTYVHDENQIGIRVFGSGRNRAAYRLYSLKIYDGANLVRDFIPVRFTNEQGVSEGAMYDRVSGQLFRNAGTGVFGFGTDIAGGGYKCLGYSPLRFSRFSRLWKEAA